MAIGGLFEGYIDQNPEQGYFGYQNQWKTPNQKKWFQSQFSNIQNQYMGQLGQQVLSGGAPTKTFEDFLSQFNWGQNFQEQTPQQRGQDTSRYNPWTRWMV